jgi:hypothetical protein
MVGEHVTGSPDPDAIALGSADVRAMLELVGETDPGPFLQRTIELGRYLGIRREGLLVGAAAAGRMGEAFASMGFWRRPGAVRGRDPGTR